MRLTRTLLRAVSSSSTAAHSSSSSMLFLSEQNVQKVLTMKDCLQVNRQAFQALANGTARVPTRLGLPYGNNGDWTLFKPASLTDTTDNTPDKKDMMGIKVVSVRAQNPSNGKPLVPATILSIDPASGMVQGVIAGTFLTAARTATGSALSTLLCQQSSHKHIQRVTIFGAGLQARMHVYALSTALATQQDLLSESQRQYYQQQQQTPEEQQSSPSPSSSNNNNKDQHQIPIPHLTIINRTPANAQALKNALEQDASATWAHQIDIIDLSDSLAVAAAVADSQVIYTTTNTPTPLFDSHSLVTPGTHVASVGSYTPDMQELPARLVDHCRVFVDTPEAMQVGDLRHLATTPQHPVTLLGWALLQHSKQQQQQPPPQSDTTDNHDPQASWWEDDQWVDPQVHYCTFFKSVGTAIQDVTTANLVVDKARQLGIGTEIAMDE